MYVLYQVFVDNDFGIIMFKLEVERFQVIEYDVVEIFDRFMVGLVCLNILFIKDFLYGFVVVWKMRYFIQLYEEVKVGQI